MPHLSFEYSANLGGQIDVQELCDITLNAALETGVFPLGGTRVRTHPCPAYAIADQHPNNAFLHLMISVGSGRSEEVRHEAGDHIWTAITTFLGPLFEQPYFALTMEIREIHPITTWKKNSIHARVNAQKN